MRGHGYELVTNPPIWARGPRHVLVTNREGFILDDAFGPLHTGEIERAKEWGAQLVRRIVVHPEGWAIWDRLVGNEWAHLWTTVPGAQNFLTWSATQASCGGSCAA